MSTSIYSQRNVLNKALRKKEFSEFFILRVRELFGFQSFEIFWKNPVFPNLQIFCKKILGQKPLLLGQKNLFLRQKQGFSNIPNLRNILNLFYPKFSKNYKKMMSKSKVCEKLVPTRIFDFKFGAECRALVLKLS